jgi:hypothetical protein
VPQVQLSPQQDAARALISARDHGSRIAAGGPLHLMRPFLRGKADHRAWAWACQSCGARRSGMAGS